MSLTPQLMKYMPNDQLVAALHAEINPLTSTAAELILLDRIEELLDGIDAKVTSAAAEYAFGAPQITALGDALIGNVDNTVALLHAICEAGIDDPKELKTRLEGFDKFCALAEDAGDVFTRLSQLTTTVQEE